MKVFNMKIMGTKEVSAILLIERDDMISGCIIQNATIKSEPGTTVLFDQCTFSDCSIDECRGTPEDASIIIQGTIFTKCELPHGSCLRCVDDGNIMEE